MSESTNPAWIAAIFARMQIAYGNRFGAQYGAADDEAVRADWAKRLQFVSADRIRYALENLPPDHPPNAMQFVALCKAMRLEPVRALPNRLATTPPAHVQKRLGDVVAGLGGAFRPVHDPRAWAYRLKAREEAGERLSEFQKDAWRRSVRPEDVPAVTTTTLDPSNHAGSEASDA